MTMALQESLKSPNERDLSVMLPESDIEPSSRMSSNKQSMRLNLPVVALSIPNHNSPIQAKLQNHSNCLQLPMNVIWIILPHLFRSRYNCNKVEVVS